MLYVIFFLSLDTKKAKNNVIEKSKHILMISKILLFCYIYYKKSFSNLQNKLDNIFNVDCGKSECHLYFNRCKN